VVVVELPLRRAGFRLPDWDELVAISAWCRAHGVKLHFDGARLWESAPHYGRSLAEICALADSVYVSFYRAWAAWQATIANRPRRTSSPRSPWKTRLAGNVYTLYPMVLSAAGRPAPPAAAHGRLPRARPRAGRRAGRPARRAAGARAAAHQFLPLPAGRPGAAARGAAGPGQATGFWLGNRAQPSVRLAGGAMVEIVIGDAADGWRDEQAVAAWRAVLARC
jgi:hypothetical protein